MPTRGPGEGSDGHAGPVTVIEVRASPRLPFLTLELVGVAVATLACAAFVGVLGPWRVAGIGPFDNPVVKAAAWLALCGILGSFGVRLWRWRNVPVVLRATPDGLWLGDFPQFGIVPWGEIVDLRFGDSTDRMVPGGRWPGFWVRLRSPGDYWRRLRVLWRIRLALYGFAWGWMWVSLSTARVPYYATVDALKAAWRRGAR
jgi:hypothetical protein